MDQRSLLEQIADRCDEINDLWYEVRDLAEQIQDEDVRSSIISAFETAQDGL